MILAKHISRWTWDVEWNKIIQFLCIMFAQGIAIDNTCSLEMFFKLLVEKYIVSWEAWYAHLIHYFWTLTLYFFYFLYGVVWTNQYDMGYAVGMEI